ncbi:MAG: serine hydrolase [Bacteroidetes bacterium]|nr:serine hydrolase [Bacteroidota bacterium]
MKKRLSFTLLLIFLGSAVFVTGQTNNSSQEGITEQAWVDSVFNSLSPDERIAQLLLVRANDAGKDYFPEIDKYISEYNIGGLCFFRNHPYNQAVAVNRWQSMSKTPLLMSMDAEWGLGMRLDSTTSFPYQMTLGAIHDDDLIYQMGATIAEQCKRIGIHMNFAPVVDINSNPANPVIGMRSFGQDKENVMLKGMAYMQGLQEHGIIATAKHFPGHGDTDSDSHKTLPVITHSQERLDSLELYPFRQLINNGLGGIMIAHLYIPAYEKREGMASTLSPDIVTKLLSEELGFHGLIVTDALDMKGVTKYHKPGNIEVKALLAGNDILLLPANVPKAVKQIHRAVKDGELDVEVINAGCRKVLTYKYRAGLSEAGKVETEGLYEDLNSPQASALNRQLYEASATLIRNKHSLIPLTHLDTLSIACVATGGSLEEDHFGKILKLYGRVDMFELPDHAREKDVAKLLDQLEAYNLVIVGVQNTNILPFRDYGIPEITWAFIRKLTAKKKVILELFGSPYALSGLGSDELPEAIIISYQDNRLSREVGAEVIFGGIGASGKLPVGISGLFEAGSGIKTEANRLRFVDPASMGISEEMLAKADSIAQSGIILKAYPGCQVLAAKDGNIFYHKAFGYHTYERKEAVKLTDLYDLASLTKIAATTLAMMDIYGQGAIDIDQRLSYYLPYLRGTDKEGIVIRELMAHQSRFQAWIPYYQYTVEDDNPDPEIYRNEISEDYNVRVAEGMYIQKDYYCEILDSIRYSELRIDNRYQYSDLGFYLLKEAIEVISNSAFEKFTEASYYRPLGLPTMAYLPLKRFKKEMIAPTEDDKLFRKQLLQGDVHDQGAAMLGGISGHAGLFSNAFDMAVIMQLFMNGGVYGGERYFNEELIGEFTSTQFPLNENRRGIGFDKPMLEYDEDGSTCRSVSPDSYGHSGFTGTYAWADPENGLVYIFLSNRIHPEANNSKIMEYDIRTNLHQVFYDAVENVRK